MVLEPVRRHARCMTTTPPDASPAGPPGPAASGPRVSREEMRDLAQIRRSTTDRHVAGVAGGLGRHLDIDPVILRVAFVVLALFGGSGLILYAVCWALIPEDTTDRALIDLDARTRTAALVGIGIIACLMLVGGSWGFWDFPWPLVILGVIVYLIVNKRNRRGAVPPAPPGAGPPVSLRKAGPAPAYGPPAAPVYAPATGAYAPPATAPYQTMGPPPRPSYPVRPPNPRKRGPILFWFTLALLALTEGLLGFADLAGLDVAASAYLALAVGVFGLMLVVGAWWGRAGGLIAFGLVTAVVLAGVTAVERLDAQDDRVAPTTADEVDSEYWRIAGDLELDLTRVSDLEHLDGRQLTLATASGRLRVVVPKGVDVSVDAEVTAGGTIETFGEREEGSDIHVVDQVDGGVNVPDLDLDVWVGLGEIEVVQR